MTEHLLRSSNLIASGNQKRRNHELCEWRLQFSSGNKLAVSLPVHWCRDPATSNREKSNRQQSIRQPLVGTRSIILILRLPGCSDPGCSDPGCSDPGCSDPGCSDPGCSDPGCSDPGCSDPGCSDPGCSDPGCSDPGCSDPRCSEARLPQKKGTKLSLIPFFLYRLLVIIRWRLHTSSTCSSS